MSGSAWEYYRPFNDKEEYYGYSCTYFGQFIDHDLTFDPASSLQRQNDPDALVDYRPPRFDLGSVYGRGQDDQPYLYEDGRRFILGKPLTGAAANPRAKDLPRSQTQLAYKIDTSLVNPLGNLPPSVAVNPNILAQRNLERGWRMRLPNGQSVARAMGRHPLPDSQIIIGKFTGDPADIIGPINTINPAFTENCPLWSYVLAETVETDVTIKTTKGDKKIKTRKLGPVGGRVVTETFVGLLLGDSSSYLAQDPLWTPSLAVLSVFGLRELIATALQG